MPFPHEELNLTAYSINTGGSPDFGEYGPQISQLSFSTIAPGGCGDLTVRLNLPNPRLYRPHLRMFANIALWQGKQPLFVGRWDEPGYVVSANDGEYLQLTAMGAGQTLGDDPEDATYSAKTGKQIITDQLQGATLGRANWLNIDTDLTQVFPDNPATTYNYNPQAHTIEDVLNEITAIQGDYLWYVWPHPLNRDSVKMPTWQVSVLQRNFATASPTVHYTGTVGDYSDVDYRPALEYSFNAVTIKYKDQTTGLPASVTVKDGRLNTNNSQGSAPFPYRVFTKDLASYNLTATQAAAIANAYLNEYKNGGFKITVKLESVTDGSGGVVPLAQVRAGNNILLPEITPAAAQLVYTSTANTNLYFIQQTQYNEQEGQLPTLTVTLNSFSDAAAFQVARLQYGAVVTARSSSRSTGTQQSVGQPEKGVAGPLSWGTAGVSTDTFRTSTNFKSVMVNVPSSITLTTLASSNSSAPTVDTITNHGFTHHVNPSANGAGFYQSTYLTVGN
jgi:hypothetical protein